MRVILSAFGFIGNTGPLLTLAKEFHDAGHQPILALPSNCEADVKESGIEWVSAGPPLFLKMIERQPTSARHLLWSSDKVLGALGDIYSELLTLCRNADILIGAPFDPACRMVHDTISIPFVSLHLSPFIEFDRKARELSAARLNPYWVKEGLLSTPDPFGPNGCSKELALYAISSQVLDRPITWASHQKIVGFFSHDQEFWQPERSLAEFCSAPEKPVVLALDDVACDGREGITRIAIDALRQENCRAIFSQPGCDDSEGILHSSGHYVTSSAPYSWLFARAAMVVHQGDAAASAGAFCAGVPTLVIPHTPEQKSWGALSRAKGCARSVIPFSHLTVARLAMAIRSSLTSASARQAAEVLARQIKAEGGAKAARLLVEELVARRHSLQVSDRNQAGQSSGVEKSRIMTPLLRRVEREAEMPLSFAQQRLWLIDQLEPGGFGYNMAFGLRLSGEMNREALRRAVNAMVARHEVLRTTFPARNGKPAQKISDQLDLQLEDMNLEFVPERERKAEIDKMMQEEMERPFHLAQGPLLRVKLARLGDRDHVLFGSVHHIVSDGWAVGIILKEISLHYAAFCKGEEPNLAELKVQYADFAVWQRECLQGDLLEQQLQYWRSKLAGISALEFPADHPRPATMSYRSGRVPWMLPVPAAQKLKQFSRRLGLTPFMTLLAVVQVTLSKYTGQEDVAVGTPIANRNRKELEELIGCFVNTLVLRTDLQGNPVLSEALKRARQVSVDAYQYQDVPFEMVVQELQPERDLTRTPFFQVMLALHNVDSGSLELPGLTLSNYFSAPERIKFDLMLDLMEWEDGGFGGDVSYACDLYEQETILRLVGHLQVVLDTMMAEPGQEMHEFSLLTSMERRQVLNAWNQTETSFPRLSVQRSFEEQVAKTPDAVAVAFQGEELTYAELNLRANRLGSYLRNQGVSPGEIVALMGRRNINFVIGMIAVWKLGAAYLPLDSAHPPARWQQLIEQSGTRWVVVEDLFRDAVRSVVERIQIQRSLALLSIEQALELGNSEETLTSFVGSASDLAYVIYTSGSTGVPKGVMVEQSGLVNHLHAMIQDLRLGREDRMAQTASQNFDISVWQFVALLLVGGRTEIIPDDALHDPFSLWKLVRDKEITVLELVPSLLVSLTRVVEKEKEAKPEEKGLKLRWFLVTGEAVTPQACRDWISTCPQIPLINAYGPAECSDDVTLHEIREEEVFSERAPIGRPIANLKVYILDQYLNPVPIGAIGELYIGGIGVGRGYLGDVVRTAEAYVPDALSGDAGSRVYRTGDLGRYRQDGVIEYLGRMDHQVKVRGYRIELGEIEAALAGCAGVQEAVVIVAGEDEGKDKRLVGYVVLDIAGKPSIKELKESLKARLPEYMIPGVMMELDRLPLTENGKVDRKALPKMQGERSGEYGGPRLGVEEVLASIWSDVLKVERVGARDNFFDLGGHSLLGTQLMSRVQEVFQVDLPLRRLFEYSTLEELGRVIEEALGHVGTTGLRPIPCRRREEKKKLSYAQQRLWFLHQLEPNNASYNVAAAVKMEGELDVGALTQSLKELLRRHEVLRARFVMGAEGEPEQEVMEGLEVDLAIRQVEGNSAAERWRAVDQISKEEAQQPFDLRTGPLVRARLMRLGLQEHVALLTMHHIVSDGWSMGVLIEEMGELYRAYSQGKESPLQDLPIQYSDFAAWQREWLQGEVLEKQLGYWRKQLEGLSGILEVPADYSRPATQSHCGAHYGVSIDDGLAQKLRELARRENITLFMLLMAAFQSLLWRYTGQRDIAVGTPIANRQRVETEKLIGFFVNTLVVRLNINEHESFLKLLKDMREVTLGAYAHQDIPFERLVEELNPQRDSGHSPLFQVLFALQNVPQVALRLEKLDLNLLWGDLPASKFDLSLKLEEAGGGLGGAWEYSTDLFEKQTIVRMAGHWQELLRGIVAGPERRVADMPLLSAAERTQLVQEWNRTSVKRVPKNVVELFEEHVDRTPAFDAVVYEGQHLNYDELNRRANQFARYLREMGVGPEVRVALCLERSLEMVVALLGVLKAGGAYVPLDPSYPVERLSYTLEDSQAAVLVTNWDLLQRLPSSWIQAICVDRDWDRIKEQAEQNPVSEIASENLAYVIYTSGSTGRPKGAGITHGGLSNYIQSVSWRLKIKPGWRWGWASTVAADLGNTMLFPALCGGGALHVIPAEVARDGRAMGEYGSRERLDCLKITPTHLQSLLASGPGTEIIPKERLVLGGEASTWEWIGTIEEKHRACGIWNHYGPTEATVGAAMYEINNEPRRSNASKSKGSVPIGNPLENTQLYVLDGEMAPAPVGVPGELYIGGAGLARGYLGRADLTGERFVPNPHGEKEGARLYRTGDRARWRSDGQVEYLGRVDGQVKLRGHRIELGEIEAVMTEHAAVKQAAVVVREEAGEKRLVGYVVSADGMDLEVEELRSHLRSKLPEYMVPGLYVGLKAMPLTSNGKLDWRALPELQGGGSSAKMFVGPRTAEEEILCGIWRDVLRLEQVGVADSFFDLGGHSLLATQVISRVREVFQIELPLQILFDQPTIAGLARAIEQTQHIAGSHERPPIVRADREQGMPLSYAQQRLWFLAQLAPGDVSYNVPRATRFMGRLDVDALQRALSEVVRRHESLRTRFVIMEGEPQQVMDVMVGAMPVVDLSDLESEERETYAHRLVREESQTGFNLAAGPLLRMKLLRLSEEDHVLLLTMHHIVSDAWSAGILIRETSQLYGAFREGKPSPLPELSIQYADFSVWQRKWLSREVLEEKLGYWRRQLAGVSALNLPTDRSRPTIWSSRGAMLGFMLDEGLAKELKELGRAEGATLYMTMLAALQVLLGRYSGQSDIAVGSPIAARTQAETEGLIGCFVNTIVLRTEMRSEESYRTLLGRTRELTLVAYAHQEVPFEMLVEELQPRRDLSRTPLFQVMLALQNVPDLELQMPGLRLCSMEAENTESKFDLTLFINSSSDGLSAAIEYSTDLFDQATIHRLWSHWEVLLRGIVRTPEAKIADLTILSEAERRQVVEEWNQTERECPREKSVIELFEAQVINSPGAIAAVCSGETLTYNELNVRATRLARVLQRMGVGAEQIVALLMERNLNCLIGIIGIWKAGGTYLPLNAGHPVEHLQQVIQQSGTRWIITEQLLSIDLKAALESVPAERRPEVIDLEEVQRSKEVANGPTEGPYIAPQSLAYVIYTSGSTGMPKGVMVEHGGMLNHLYAKIRDLRLESTDRIAQTASQSFDISVWQFVAALLVGGTVEIVPEETAHDPIALWGLVQKNRITILELVPSLLGTVLATVLSEADPRDNPAPLRWMIVTGEAVHPQVCRDWAKLCPGVPMLNAYGPTECSDDVTHYEIPAMSHDFDRVPIGRAVGNIRIYILDQQKMPVPVGIPGELYVGGVGVGRGYLNASILTAEAFVPDPFSGQHGARLYRTGDLARYRSDGVIEYGGRIDHQVKVRGYRIELGAIEATLEACAGVTGAVVVLEEGGGDRRLVAYVTQNGSDKLNPREIKEALRRKLPDYMVPAVVTELDQIPLTQNGKVDRKALPKVEIGSVDDYVAPRTATEEALTRLWLDLLNMPRIGVNDNFFDVGGHSLLVTRVVSRISKDFHIDVPLVAFFNAPTIADLAVLLTSLEPKPGAAEKIAKVLNKVDRLSSEEVKAALEQKKSLVIAN